MDRFVNNELLMGELSAFFKISEWVSLRCVSSKWSKRFSLEAPNVVRRLCRFEWKSFLAACELGKIRVLAVIAEPPGDAAALNVAFQKACWNGHLEVAQWLAKLPEVDPNAKRHDAFKWACYNGHLALAQWLKSLQTFQPSCSAECKEAYSLAFQWACTNGQLAVAQWLASLPLTNPWTNDSFALVCACSNGHLDVAKWLVTDIGLEFQDSRMVETFKAEAQRNGKSEMFEWLSEMQSS
jgi:hypothetical protein